MRSGIGRLIGKGLLYLAIFVAIIGGLALQTPEFFTPVPSERQAEVVGDWYVDRFGSFRHYVFRSDGTGEIWAPGRETREFKWGTEGELLRLKYKTYNGWSVPDYRYSFDPKTDQLSLEAVSSGYSMVMKREAPASAAIE